MPSIFIADNLIIIIRNCHIFKLEILDITIKQILQSIINFAPTQVI